MLEYIAAMEKANKTGKTADRMLSIRVMVDEDKEVVGQTAFDNSTTAAYFDALRQIASEGVSFKDKVALVTGISPGSITEPIVGALLEGGATVIATTRLNSAPFSYFQKTYEQRCGAGSRLIVVPFNQGSTQDVDNVLEHIYKPTSAGGLGSDVDFCFPFAALP